MPLYYATSARKNPLLWLVLLVGLIFMLTAFFQADTNNCDEGGDCAPWLIPFAFAIGALFSLLGLSGLIVNPKYGYRIDLVHQQLYWWANARQIREQSLSIRKIARIHLRCHDENPDEIFFYDAEGNLLPIPSSGIYAGQAKDWVSEFCKYFPHIHLSIEES